MSTRKRRTEKPEPDQEAVGDDRKTVKKKLLSHNSKGLTEIPSPSKSPNGSASNLMPSTTEEKENLSSTSTNTVSVLSFQRKPDPEMDREGTLVIHFSTYGKSSQAQKAAHTMVQELQVRGYNILDALYNDEPLDFDNKWAEPVIGGPQEPVIT